MAKKLINMTYGVIVSIHLLLFFGSFFVSADGVVVNSTIGSDILSTGNSARDEYDDSEALLHNTTFDEGDFLPTDSSLIEQSGKSQGNIIGKDNPATIKNMLSSFGNYLRLPYIITSFIISLVIVTGVNLFIRLVRGEGAS